MIEQKQVSEGKNPTFSVKVSQDTYDLVNILCEGLAHGTNGNDLMKTFIHSFIESAKHEGPVTNETRMFLNMLTLDPGWHKAFNFADVTAKTDVAQLILILQQKDRKGFGLKMIDNPFCGDATETMCVDDILERIIHIAMPDLDAKIQEVKDRYDCRNVREALIMFCEYMIDALNIEEERNELPGYGDYHDFGRAIEYGNKAKGYKHCTPDSNTQQTLHFEDWEGEHRQTDFETPVDRDLMNELSHGHAQDDELEDEIGFRPHGVEW